MSTPALTARPPVAVRAPRALLRTVLRVDSCGTAAFGVVMLAGAGWLVEPLGLPAAWSVSLGIAMLGGAAALALIAGHPGIARLAAAVVAVNALSCVTLLVLACVDVAPLTGLGRAFLVVGAVVVALFAAFEYAGLRRLVRHAS